MSDADRPGAQRLAGRARTTSADGRLRADLAASAHGASSLVGAASHLAGHSVRVATSGQIAAACTSVEVDGMAWRLAIAPPDLALHAAAGVTRDLVCNSVSIEQVADMVADLDQAPVAGAAHARAAE